MLSPSRWNIAHSTVIDAPIALVWAALVDLEDWSHWNEWTRLEAKTVEAGVAGTLKASYEGNGEWESFDFYFGEVNSDLHKLTWKGKVGPGGCLFSGQHTMRLEALDDAAETTGDDANNKCRLFHTEEFGGLLPRLGLGLPYKTLDRNYLYMNDGLKKHAESKYSMQAKN
jgi:hypothetical protein